MKNVNFIFKNKLGTNINVILVNNSHTDMYNKSEGIE